jgi:hypothetical protein
VLSALVLLEGEPLAQSEVLIALAWVFIKHLLLILSLILTKLQVPAAEKHLHNMMLPLPCFTIGMVLAKGWNGAWFLPDVTFGIQAKEFNLGFIRPEKHVSHGLRVL